MNDRSISELANAEIVPDMGGPNGWLVRFGEGDYDTVNKSAKNTLILKDDVIDADNFKFGGVYVHVDFDNDHLEMERDGDLVTVPPEREEHVLWSIHDEDGPRLNKLFDELYTPTVREGLMDQFMPRFRRAETDINKQEGGWLVGGDILVSWDGSNHPVDVATTHVVRGGEAVEADETKEAREIEFSPPKPSDIQAESYQVTAPDGRTFDLDEVELRFLTTVGLILDRNPSNYDDDLRTSIEDSGVVGFTDTKSGLHHSHGMQKHTLSDLGVTDEAQSRLWYNDYDHTGVWEMAIRRGEFETAPIEVFEDAPNDSESKWRKIESTKEKAPIPKHVRSDLEARYGA